jgi:predicted dehydrogenase
VAVCDRYLDLATQAANRFAVPQAFDNLQQMLDATRPDVLHVTTPPHTHQSIVLLALAAGVHVYVEKPFSIDACEARTMIEAAVSAHRLICVGHDQLFDPLWIELRRRYDAGEFGRVVHIDSLQGYDLSGPFGRAFASDVDHWIHRLPGSFFQNTISHALYKITEFVPDERPLIQAFWFAGDGPANCPTELRVMMRGAQATAQLVSSCAARPVQRSTRLCGTKQLVEIDFDGYWIEVRRGLSLRGPFAKLQGPYRRLRQAKDSWRRNLKRFVRNELQFFAGMNGLFSRFYAAIRDGAPPPIEYSEILRVTAIMDDIFAACRGHELPSQCETPKGSALPNVSCSTVFPAPLS